MWEFYPKALGDPVPAGRLAAQAGYRFRAHGAVAGLRELA
jgi:hypothetical protein